MLAKKTLGKGGEKNELRRGGKGQPPPSRCSGAARTDLAASTKTGPHAPREAGAPESRRGRTGASSLPPSGRGHKRRLGHAVRDSTGRRRKMLAPLGLLPLATADKFYKGG